MHIVLIGPSYPLRGGIAHSTGLLAVALRQAHDVELISFKRQYPSLFFPGASQEEEGAMEGVGSAPQLVDSVNPLNWLNVGNSIRAKKPDLLLIKYWLPFFGPCFGTIARTAKRGRSTKLVYVCDNVIPHERRLGTGLLRGTRSGRQTGLSSSRLRLRMTCLRSFPAPDTGRYPTRCTTVSAIPSHVRKHAAG